MKYVILVLSISLNVYFVLDQLQRWKNAQNSKLFIQNLGLEINSTSWPVGFKEFSRKLSSTNDSCFQKNYYYLNIWNVTCKPCINEMSFLDSISGSFGSNIACIYISDNSESVATDYLKKRHLNSKNFIYINDMSNFISSICNQFGYNSKIYPLHLLVDRNGKIYYFSEGTFDNVREAKKLLEMIDSCKR